MLIVANWKAYIEDFEKAERLVSISKRVAKTTSCDIVLAPPAVFLSNLASKNTSKVTFSAQDISATAGGAQTGENTAQMYATSGASYSIIGHSERRAEGDTNDIISVKLSLALSRGLTPILCVGEKEHDSEGRYLTFIREEIVSALTDLSQKQRIKIIIAYEPLWAIGHSADSAIDSSNLTEIILYIRKILSSLLSEKSAEKVKILYGGSVKPENIRVLAEASPIDGFLIGHASTDEEVFSALLKQVQKL